MLVKYPSVTDLFPEEERVAIRADTGFFSNTCYRLFGIVDYVNAFRKFPKIVDTSFGYSLYKETLGDAAHLFFKNKLAPQVDYPIVVGDPSDPFINDPAYITFSDYKRLNFKQITPIIDAYFGIADTAEKRKEEFLQKYNIDPVNTIVAYYRGTDKKTETFLASHQVFDEKVRQIRQKYPNHKLLIQTDDPYFQQFMSERHQDAIFIKEFCPTPVKKRLITKSGRTLLSCSALPRVVRGAYTKLQTPQEKCTHVINLLAVVKIMSECHQVIMTSGNVGLWVCLLRGSADGLCCYLNTEYLFGDKNPYYDPYKSFWSDETKPMPYPQHQNQDALKEAREILQEHRNFIGAVIAKQRGAL